MINTHFQIIVQYLCYLQFQKIFEKVVFIQLYTYFQTNKLFYNHQYGFRERYLTELAALELVD